VRRHYQEQACHPMILPDERRTRNMASRKHKPGGCVSCKLTFKTGANRKKENAAFFRSVWVDCDLKFDTALLACAAFFKSSGVPLPSIIIASGGGCHLYWVFTRDITLDEWEHAAGLLGQVCAANRFEIDSKCTIDAVRILRPPGRLITSMILSPWSRGAS
jgi:hypothetical protein